MKKIVLRFLIFIFIGLGIASILIFRVMYYKDIDTDKNNDNKIQQEIRKFIYGYDFLDSNQKKLYDFLSKGKVNFGEGYYFNGKADYEYIDKVINLYNTNNEFCNSQCYRTLMEDYPEDRNKPIQAVGFAPTDEHMLAYEEYLVKMKKVDKKVQEIINNMPKNLSELNKIQYLYDYVINNIEFDNEHSEFSDSSYNGLILGKAVCSGYARAFQVLAEKVGFKVIIVVGRITMDESLHAWNMIEYNGHWYHLDATWDDNNNDYYNYFMLSDEEHNKKRLNNIFEYSKDISVPKADKPLAERERTAIRRENINTIIK